jgi:type II secretory pathway pseudopilin PulG
MLFFKKKIKKHRFTLLEIIITIIIAGFFCAFFTVKTKNAISDHKFKINMDRISTLMQYCKNSALINQKDIFLLIGQKKEGLHIQILNSHLQEPVKYIKGVSFLFNGGKTDKISICYSSTGNIFPKGRLHFFDKDGHSYNNDI